MIRALVLLLAISLHPLAAADKTSDSLIASIRAAIAQHDPNQLERLTYTAGMSESDLALLRRSGSYLTSNTREVEEISIAPLPENFESTMVARGRKYEPTAPPKGLVKVTFKPSNGGNFSTTMAFTEVDRSFFLVGTKSTDLNWQGSPDKQIGFGVDGAGQDKAKILVKWNASGIDLENPFTSPSAVLIGQHLNEVKVTSDQDDSELTLTIREDGQVVYTSETLKGKGVIEYKRK